VNDERNASGRENELPAIDTIRVALIGYGEVGAIFGAALMQAGIGAVTAFDILIDDARWAAAAGARAARDDVTLASSATAAIANADLIISAVTAASTASAADTIASTCRREAFVLDVNSASPRTKTACAAVVAVVIVKRVVSVAVRVPDPPVVGAAEPLVNPRVGQDVFERPPAHGGPRDAHGVEAGEHGFVQAPGLVEAGARHIRDYIDLHRSSSGARYR